MDGIFCKFVTCCNSVLKQPRQGKRGGAFGYFIPWVSVSVAAYVIANFCRRSTLLPRSTGNAGHYIASSGILLLGAMLIILFGVYIPVTAPPASDLARSTGDAGDYIASSVDHGILLCGAAVCVLFGVYKPVTAPLGRSTGDAGDDIVARTSDGSEKSNVVASDAVICSGVQTKSSWRTRFFFAVMRRTDTFELDCSVLGQPIGLVTEFVNWEVYLGRPMMQPQKATCALVACTVAVEAINRFVYASLHGEVTPFTWAAAEPFELLQVCQETGIWDQRTGAYVRAVLEVIQERGVPLANPTPDGRTVLELSSWQEHIGTELTQERVAKLLLYGPCVGTLWVCPWYHLFDASHNDAWVYRGCGRSQDNRDKSKRRYGKWVGSHAVVCLGYRRCGDQVHVLVLDNHKATGPRRWVHVHEIDGLYTLTVDPSTFD